jgi:hypothetical protein
MAELVRENRQATEDEAAVIRPTSRPDAAAWSPTNRSWRPLAARAPTEVTGLERYPDVWTGSAVLVWAAASGHPLLLDPSGDGSWRGYPAIQDGFHQEAPVVWVGDAAVIWSGEPRGTDDDPNGCCAPSAGGYVFRLSA